jgi:CRISPR/Cas system CSM-associated protein Csm2 small subunit
MTTIEKEFLSRKDEIKKELKFLFKANMKITDWDIPETDNTKAAEALYAILQEGLDEIKEDIKEGKFD